MLFSWMTYLPISSKYTTKSITFSLFFSFFWFNFCFLFFPSGSLNRIYIFMRCSVKYYCVITSIFFCSYFVFFFLLQILIGCFWLELLKWFSRDDRIVICELCLRTFEILHMCDCVCVCVFFLFYKYLLHQSHMLSL